MLILGDIEMAEVILKWIWRLRPQYLLRERRWVAVSDSLPTKNEEYGKREYWCVLTHHSREKWFLLNCALLRDAQWVFPRHLASSVRLPTSEDRHR